MKYSTVLLAAVFAAGASAQVTRADFPACALKCLQDAIAAETDCSVEDTTCSCDTENNKKITAAATPCVLSACEGADISKTLDVSAKICAPGNDAGGAPAQESSSAAPESTSTAVEETTSVITSVATSTTTSAAEEVTSVPAEETTDAPVVPAPTGNTTAPVAPPAFTGAAGKLGAGLGSVAAFALAALAL